MIVGLVLAAAIPSAVVSWLACHAVRRAARRWNLFDRPGDHKTHNEPVATGGGLGIWLGVVLPFAVGQLVLVLWKTDSLSGAALARWFPETVLEHLPGLWAQSGRLWTALGGATVLLVLGLIDDRRGLDWRLRLGVETAVAVFMCATGWRLTLFLDWPWLTAALTVLWIVGLINAFNMLDNMDGLAAGVGLIASVVLAVVMLLVPASQGGQPQLFVAGFLMVLAGALAGFLCHNRPPARLFMGDGGSYVLGFWLAVMTLTATFVGENVPPHAILAPLCVMAVPIYDLVTVIAIRIRAGRSPFEGDRNHFSHRLVELGMTRPQAVLTIYLATATCGLGALLLHQVTPAGALVILAMVACTLLLVAILEATGRRQQRRHGRQRTSNSESQSTDAP